MTPCAPLGTPEEIAKMELDIKLAPEHTRSSKRVYSFLDSPKLQRGKFKSVKKEESLFHRVSTLAHRLKTFQDINMSLFYLHMLSPPLEMIRELKIKELAMRYTEDTVTASYAKELLKQILEKEQKGAEPKKAEPKKIEPKGAEPAPMKLKLVLKRNSEGGFVQVRKPETITKGAEPKVLEKNPLPNKPKTPKAPESSIRKKSKSPTLKTTKKPQTTQDSIEAEVQQNVDAIFASMGIRRKSEGKENAEPEPKKNKPNNCGRKIQQLVVSP